ncbi:unnamed protein product [Cladocopium goreaui]|uniref:U6 snRNA phosphodiesterase 1 n=1 Tax=Cladocopium goreaui TaxID=2562237 RepID=A0A9P1FLY7_9DINO|nr:unnamed protein product [Cladocopium goreaui]
MADASDASESSESSASSRPAKQRRLEVPSSLQSLFARSEDPRAHGGRTRRVPHVEGNFATLVFVPIKPKPLWEAIGSAAVAALQRLGASEATMVAKEGTGWHISLSPLLMLRRQFIRPFEERLRKVVDSLQVPESLQEQIWFNETLDVFASPEGDRYFAGVSVSDASARWLRGLAQRLRGCAQDFGLEISDHDLETLQLHCSLAWTMSSLTLPGEPKESPFGRVWSLEDRLPQVPSLRAHALRLRVGDRTQVVPFPGCDGSDSESESQWRPRKCGQSQELQRWERLWIHRALDTLGLGLRDIGSGTDVFVHIKDCTDGKQPLTGDILSFVMEPSASKPGQMVAKSVEGGTGAKEMFPGPQEPAPEVPGTGTHVGKVRTWNDSKGYGFIDLPGQPNVWLHVKECVNTQPQVGDWVRFDVQPSETKQGQMVAKNVTGGSQPLGSRPGFGPVRTGDLSGAATAYSPYAGASFAGAAPQAVATGGYVVQQGMPMQQQVGMQQYGGMQGQYVQQGQMGQMAMQPQQQLDGTMQAQYVQQGQMGQMAMQPQQQLDGTMQAQYAQQGQMGQMGQVAMQPQQVGMQPQNGYQQYAVQQPQMQQYGMQQQGMQMQPQYQQGYQPGMQMGMQPQGYQQMGMQPQQMQFQQAMPMQQPGMQPMQQGFMQQVPQQQMGQPMMQPDMQTGFSMGAAGMDPNAQMSLSGVAPAAASIAAPAASLALDAATAPALAPAEAPPLETAPPPAEPAAVQAAPEAAPAPEAAAAPAAPAPAAPAEAAAEPAAEPAAATPEADASAVAAATPQ